MKSALRIVQPGDVEEPNDILRPRPPRRSRSKPQPLSRRLVRSKEAAEYLGVTTWKLHQLVHDRRLPVVQDGDGPFLFDVRDLDGFIERSKKLAE